MTALHIAEPILAALALAWTAWTAKRDRI